jgi:glucose-specific phosphotransferase system IIA component
MFFKKKSTELFAPVAGKLIPLEQVADPVFSTKMMGDGFAITPENGSVFSPATGTVSSVFPTKHAIGILTTSKLELLIHIGIDTVELAGVPFEMLVKEGDKLTPATPLAKVDLNYLKEKNKASEIMVIITNMDHVKEIEALKPRAVTVGELVTVVR